MTNPNDAVGTNAAFGGRTSVNAFNDGISTYSRGIMSGWACSPDSGLTVSLGGDGTTRDVAIAEDNAGNKTTVNNISGSPINVTISAAPSTNSRIDLIVGYVDNPPAGSSTVTDNPAPCGLIVVKGTAAATPVAPNESAIRSAITADGASGTNAYYVVLASITIASGTTTLTSSNITAGSNSEIGVGSINLTQGTTTQTITWKNGNTTVGTTTCIMIPLDSNGLTLCLINGTAWNSNSSAIGEINIKGSWQTSPSTYLGGVVDCCIASDTGSYKTYGLVSKSSFDIWFEKTSAGTRDVLVQAVMLAYF